MSKSEFLMLAYPYRPDKDDIVGAFVSEKLDGCRCFWDGGISIGIPKSDIPWANNAKDERYTEELICTGLWTRYGNIIHAPYWWVANLPRNILLDGELWAGRKLFQLTRKIISKLPKNRNDNDWKRIQFRVFDSPCVEEVFKDRYINTTQFKKVIDVSSRAICDKIIFNRQSFNKAYEQLKNLIHSDSETIVVHEQYHLPGNKVKAEQFLSDLLNTITDAGGEGLIIRQPHSTWVPERTHNLMKVKPYLDAEAKVIGYITGRETDKGSKLLGMLGALIVEYNNKQFELSGFTDTERELGVIDTYKGYDAKLWAENNPGEICPYWISSSYFPRGSIITFRYRELTNEGIPKEARYLRGY